MDQGQSLFLKRFPALRSWVGRVRVCWEGGKRKGRADASHGRCSFTHNPGRKRPHGLLSPNSASDGLNGQVTSHLGPGLYLPRKESRSWNFSVRGFEMARTELCRIG